MIKLIVGNKGSGKTKTLIKMVNEALVTTNGNVVCVEKGRKLTYDLDHAVRLINIDEYNITDFNMFYGFIAGLHAGNYDLTDVFVDATFKIGGYKYEEFAVMIDSLAELIKQRDSQITFTVSCDISDLPERIKKYTV